MLNPFFFSLRILDQHSECAGGQSKRSLHAFCDALSAVTLKRDAIDDCFNVVHLVSTEFERVLAACFERLANVHNDPVHTRADEPLLLQALEHIFVKTLFPADNTRTQHRALLRKLREQRFDNLARACRLNRIAAAVQLLAAKFFMPAGGRAAARIEQSEVIPNLCGRRDGGARRVTAAALFDRNSWRKPFDRLDIWLCHLIEELARVGAERLHVLALAFRKDRVERE